MNWNTKGSMTLSYQQWHQIQLLKHQQAPQKTVHQKTTTKHLEVLVTITSKGVQQYVKKNRDDSCPENTDDDRRTLFFPGAKTIQQLSDLAAAQLKTYYYAGLRGKFTTFGIPFFQSGDNVEIRDTKLPERNGVYKVKSVEYSGGVGGLCQEVSLDYKFK